MKEITAKWNPVGRAAVKYTLLFFKWVLIAGIIGIQAGIVGSLFYISVQFATDVRAAHRAFVWLLPAGGLVIVALYRVGNLGLNAGTDRIIHSVRTDETVPIVMVPLIYVSTVITHFCGGSAGREGAALQIGGGIGAQVGRWFHLDEKDLHIVTLCGMSGVFSALFGTPLTAALFAMEVVSVGVLYYSALVPCLVSSVAAYQISLLFHIVPTRFSIPAAPSLSVLIIGKTALLAIFCALISIIFCVAVHETNRILSKTLRNEYLRIAAGGVLLLALTLLVGTGDYNGAGVDVIAAAVAGSARPEAFVLKVIFTVITIGAGFKGGEIIPSFFIGATFGCFTGGLLGLDAGFGAAVGLVAVFCGLVNCPVASILLSVELFGSQGLILFALACGVSYVLSGYFGLYGSQKIVYSKLKAEFIDQNVRTKW